MRRAAREWVAQEREQLQSQARKAISIFQQTVGQGQADARPGDEASDDAVDDDRHLLHLPVGAGSLLDGE